MPNEIIIKNANVNNLKHFSVRIPRDKLVVLTGLSGSGKSSLAFETIYAEGQRRYIESLSSYARQFLGQMDKPDVESIEGLSPAISIDQKTTSKNPRSTVGTVTEIHDYLRLLYARIGRPHCPVCGRPITSQSVDQIVDTIMGFPERTKLMILAPVVRGRKGEHVKLLDRIRRDGYTRVRVDGEILLLDEDEIRPEKNRKHTIEIVVDRIIVKPGQEGRIAEAVELAMKEGNGLTVVAFRGEDGVQREQTFSSKLACPEHGVSIEELEPRMFSFNSPFGACPTCSGLGFTEKIDPEKFIYTDKSIAEGALSRVFGSMEYSSFYRKMVEVLAEEKHVDLNTPYRDLPKDFLQELLHGTGTRELKYDYTTGSGKVQHHSHPFEGLLDSVERRYREYAGDAFRDRMAQYMIVRRCPDCQGRRLKPEVLAVTVGGLNIAELSDLSVRKALDFVRELPAQLTEKEQAIGSQIIREIRARLQFLADVGLDYLTLSRSSATLSGGEAQRIRLATQIGSGLQGVLYILDEPSIGLHQKDNEKLLKTLRHLTDIGNTLIVVEHDEDTMREADHVVDIGPGAGIYGGHLVAQGTVEDIMACPESITGQYLSGKRKIPVPAVRREGNGQKIRIRGAAENNLKHIDVDIPLGKFVAVTGVSGSGKSSLINQILCKGASRVLNGSQEEPGQYDELLGLENLDKVINIDQSPIGRTPRSNPATYTGMFTAIRDLFAAMPEAKMRGFGKGRFSFNVKGGRCEACKGDGIIKIEMHFLSDVYVPCEVCHGKRYNRETLEVKYNGKNIYDVLNMSVAEALDFFKNMPSIHRKLDTLHQVGLDYIKLGQPSTELSGGEAQRIKLATELSKRSTGRTLYILDEPTTGLHFADVDKLLQVLQKLTDGGNTVVVIEHNLDVIKQADWVIDLGPEGGDRGGTIVAQGTPEDVAASPESYTGAFLKKMLP
ncbi:excinuclease ABC subunit UvrA [Eubacterium pyruvativorans]|uniref:excinuclease ABC subunit UvrA n=1 Tax=Eubacterium pyruvativorans TaxID=155865 RepID=UPI00088B0D2F|nr:excinuclease ABC subunit UvrA [Eubacterium pyruvativorans]MDO5568206.1 excinuclease ABC subunit UvrA [Eubacteriales bacterium]SDF33498.1 excinuclease ABC subunit A [Eubacterium pyruvativorans]